MNPQDCVAAVCRIVADFRRVGDRSVLDLLKSSGYVDQHSQVTEDDIKSFLIANPELIDTWIGQGADGRGGYYMLTPTSVSNSSGAWVVGPPRGSAEHFQDGFLACARFIKLSAENWRYMIEGGPPIKRRR